MNAYYDIIVLEACVRAHTYARVARGALCDLCYLLLCFAGRGEGERHRAALDAAYETMPGNPLPVRVWSGEGGSRGTPTRLVPPASFRKNPPHTLFHLLLLDEPPAVTPATRAHLGFEPRAPD